MKDMFNCLSGDVSCIEGFWDCGACMQEMRRRIWRDMSEKQREYDRMVDPLGFYTSGYSAGLSLDCSCHINPPCAYCMSKGPE